MTEEHRTYLFGLLEKQFGKMSTRERLIAGSIIDEAVNLATKELQMPCNSCHLLLPQTLIDKNKELQEEVNEWKTKFKNLQKYLDTQNCYRECAETWKRSKKLQEENEQAKEIIRDFLSIAIDYIDKEDKNYSLIVEAEAFINKE